MALVRLPLPVMMPYIALSNRGPTLFVWTKTAYEILASVARFCHRISVT